MGTRYTRGSYIGRRSRRGRQRKFLAGRLPGGRGHTAFFRRRGWRGSRSPGVRWGIGLAAILCAIGLGGTFHSPAARKEAAIEPSMAPSMVPSASFFTQASPGPEDRVVQVYDPDEDRLFAMGMEDYVYHVLAAEMPARFEPEALKAQAVAARTFAAWKIRGGGCGQCAGADVCTRSNHCQAFSPDPSSGWGTRAGEYEDKLRRAVADTAGETITYNGKPIEVLYHADAGGHTQDVEAVFAQALPYLRGVESPDSSEKRQEAFSRQSFVKAILAAYPKAGISAKKLHTQVRVLERDSSGRVARVQVGKAVLSGVELRRAVGLRSANFSITFTTKDIVFATLGYGHGVGMSQTGADAMAKAGSGYEAILKHYYTGVEITPWP